MASRYTNYYEAKFEPLTFQELSLVPTMMYKMHQESLASASEIDEKAFSEALPFDKPLVDKKISEIKEEASSIIEDIQQKGVKESDAVSRVMNLKKKFTYEFSEGIVAYAKQAYQRKKEIDEEINKIALDPKSQISTERAEYLKIRNYLDYISRGGAAEKASYVNIPAALLDAPLVEKIDNIFKDIQMEKSPLQLRIENGIFYKYGSTERISRERALRMISGYLMTDPKIESYINEEVESRTYLLPNTFKIRVPQRTNNGNVEYVEREVTKNEYKEILKEQLLNEAIESVLAKRVVTRTEYKYNTLPSHILGGSPSEKSTRITSSSVDYLNILDFSNYNSFISSLKKLREADDQSFQMVSNLFVESLKDNENLKNYLLNNFSDALNSSYTYYTTPDSKGQIKRNTLTEQDKKRALEDFKKIQGKILTGILQRITNGEEVTQNDFKTLYNEALKDLPEDSVLRNRKTNDSKNLVLVSNIGDNFSSNISNAFGKNKISRLFQNTLWENVRDNFKKYLGNTGESLGINTRSYEISFDSTLNPKLKTLTKNLLNLGDFYEIGSNNELRKSDKKNLDFDNVEIIGIFSKQDFGRPLFKIRYRKSDNKYDYGFIDLNPAFSSSDINNQVEDFFSLLINSPDPKTSSAARRLSFEYYSSLLSPLNINLSLKNQKARQIISQMNTLGFKNPIDNSMITYNSNQRMFNIKIDNNYVKNSDVLALLSRFLNITNKPMNQKIQEVNSFLYSLGFPVISENNLSSTYSFNSMYDAYNFLTSLSND
ncbi:MAG: hypothetical protein QXJ28_02775 [Candidatus Pacearchaeota archaeon]